MDVVISCSQECQRDVCVGKVSPMLKLNSTTDNGFFFLPIQIRTS